MREVAAQHGGTPLDYLLAIICDDTQPDQTRMFAAKAALPYCTPRLKAVEATKDGAGRMTHEEWVRQLSAELNITDE